MKMAEELYQKLNIFINTLSENEYKTELLHIYKTNYNTGLMEKIFEIAINEKNLFLVNLLWKYSIINPKFEYANGRQALHLASMIDDLELLVYIATFYSSVNVLDDQHKSPLHLSIESGFMSNAIFLIQKGASLNRPKSLIYKYAPFHTACLLGNVELIKQMIQNGADLNTKDSEDNTPLHIAVNAYNNEIADCLIKAGSNAHVENKTNNSPFFIALSNLNLDILKSFMNCIPNVFNAVNKNGQTPLHFLSCSKEVTSQEEWRDIWNACNLSGLNINSTDKDGRTALHSAAESGNIFAAKFLVNSHISLEIKDMILEETPLATAVSSCQTHVVSYLLSEGANPNAKDKHGKYPLHKLQMCQNIPGDCSFDETAKILLLHGTNINCLDRQKNTVLDQCVFHLLLTNDLKKFQSMIGLLIIAGLKLEPPPKTGRILRHSPLCSLAWHGQIEAAAILLEAGWNLSMEENWFTYRGKSKKIEEFFENLRNIRNNPISLQYLCRRIIRNTLISSSKDTDISMRIWYLVLPISLENFILCKTCEYSQNKYFLHIKSLVV